MFQIFLCQTKDYHPRQVEHFLHTLQKEKRLVIELRENEGKVDFISSHDWTKHLDGSRAEVQSEKQRGKSHSKKTEKSKNSFWVSQKKGPLLPIKRWSQLEDRTNKTRISPLDELIPLLAKTPNSFLRLTLRPFHEKRRERWVKKVKKDYFEPDRRFDQWESKGWRTLSLRRFLGPLVRAQLASNPTKKTQEEQTESLHEKEDAKRAVLDKLSRPLFEGQLEISHPFRAFFHGFSLPYLGELTVKNKASRILLSAEELASLLSPPTPSKVNGHLKMESSVHLPHPLPDPWNLGEEDRKRHLYLVGKTGMGKSTALLQLFQKDCLKNSAIVLMDPHGDLIEDALTLIPEKRLKDCLLLDPSNADFPLALNPIEPIENQSASLQASALIEMFQALAKGSWGPRLEHILRNCLLTLLASPNTTLLDLPRLLTDPVFCKLTLSRVNDPELRRFFEDEFLPLDPRLRQEQAAPLLNKVGPFLSSPLLRNMFGQPKSKIHLQSLLDQKKILLIKLSKGQLGEDASRFLGMIFLSMLQSTLLSRAKKPVDERPTVFVSVDEFQNFCTPSLLSMLSELRKYGLALTLANQYLTQIPEEIQEAVLGNVGSLASFRTSNEDAQVLAPSFGITEADLTQLDPFQAYSRFLRNQSLEPTFRVSVKPLSPLQNSEVKARIEKHSQALLSRPRHQVEEKLKKRYND